jgi:hypothetical protein
MGRVGSGGKGAPPVCASGTTGVGLAGVGATVGVISGAAFDVIIGGVSGTGVTSGAGSVGVGGAAFTSVTEIPGDAIIAAEPSVGKLAGPAPIHASPCSKSDTPKLKASLRR